jgi:hypothetical protein
MRATPDAAALSHGELPEKNMTITAAGVRAALACALLTTAAAQAAEMSIFLKPNFEGRQVTLRGYVPDLAAIGFHDQASSIVVRSGRWEVCTQPELKGECLTLIPGEYPTLDPRLNHRIESAREVERYAGAADDRGRNSIEIYTQPEFRGKSLRLRRQAPDLADSGFQNQASSIVVDSGRWELCSQPDFRGDCVTLGRGEYPTLDARLNHRVESVRELGSNADRNAERNDRYGRADRDEREPYRSRR